MEEERIKELVKISNEREMLPEAVYHYTRKENIKNIFQKENLSIKLTEASKFDDKLEGKTCKKYYRRALKELLKEGILSREERKVLKKIRISKKPFLYREINGERVMQSEQFRTYVACFTTLYDARKMKINYIKNENHQGICIKLISRNLLDWIEEYENLGYIVSFEKVLYGREVVDYFKKTIINLIMITRDSKKNLFYMFVPGIIEEKLNNMQYRAKAKKYSWEKEYRIIVHVPENEEIPIFGKINEGLLINIKKNAQVGVTFCNMKNEDIIDIKENLNNNNYRV